MIDFLVWKEKREIETMKDELVLLEAERDLDIDQLRKNLASWSLKQQKESDNLAISHAIDSAAARQNEAFFE